VTAGRPEAGEASAGRRIAGRPAGPARAVVATSNPAKLREIRAVLAPLPLPLVGLDAFPELRLPPEGDDYAANAVAKARAAAAHTGQAALADDSGLEVEGLGGAPGPRSARYGGPGLDDAGRVAVLLDQLAGREGAARRARFVCVAALALPDGEVATARGECRGRIGAAPRGRRGFGYDPVFEVQGRGRTMAELPAREKNRISHRARAFRALRAALLAYATDSARSRRS
jgi:XTP/dITP diphosphohydrolase